MFFKTMREVRIYFRIYLNLRIDISADDTDVLFLISTLVPVDKIDGGYIIDTRVYDKMVLDNPNTNF